MPEEGRIVVKDWGIERYITNTDDFCCKELEVLPMCVCSLHRHLEKTECFWCVEGMGYIEVNSILTLVSEGDLVHVPAGAWHRFWSEVGMRLQEISTHHDDLDVQRLNKSGRICTGEKTGG